MLKIDRVLVLMITITAFSVLGHIQQAFAVGVCDIIVEVAESPDTGTEFEFSSTAPGPEEFSLSSGEQQELNELLFGEEVTVTEEPPPGSILDSVDCEVTGGNFSPVITELENGFTILCEGEAPPSQDPEDSDITCTFLNLTVQRSIPSLSNWGLFALTGGFILFGVWAISKKKAET